MGREASLVVVSPSPGLSVTRRAATRFAEDKDNGHDNKFMLVVSMAKAAIAASINALELAQSLTIAEVHKWRWFECHGVVCGHGDLRFHEKSTWSSLVEMRHSHVTKTGIDGDGNSIGDGGGDALPKASRKKSDGFL